MTSPEAPLYDPCEDCMASGGQRDANGEGTCGSCGGTGRRPANALAHEEVRQREAHFQQSIQDRADWDDGRVTAADVRAEDLAERHEEGLHEGAPDRDCAECAYLAGRDPRD